MPLNETGNRFTCLFANSVLYPEFIRNQFLLYSFSCFLQYLVKIPL